MSVIMQAAWLAALAEWLTGVGGMGRGACVIADLVVEMGSIEVLIHPTFFTSYFILVETA